MAIGMPNRHRRTKESERVKASFGRVRKAEKHYAIQLRKIARHIGDIIRGHSPGPELQRMLRDYSRLIEPWARTVAASVTADIFRRDSAEWKKASKELGRLLEQEVQSAPTGEAVRGFLNEQVRLITTMPLNAAERVHKLTLEAQVGSKRASEVAAELLRSGEVAISDANRIARTEVARTASGFTMVRAQHIGSEGYIWRTAGDSDVRKSHREMEGKFIRWDTIPTLSDGTKTHAGMIYECRCYPEPVIPEIII